MRVITEITQQQKNKKRYNIFLDGHFAFSVSDEALVRHHLKPGDVFQQNRLEELLRQEEARTALSRAMDYLCASAKTVRQTGDYLEKKGFSEQAAAFALERLQEQKILDDRAYVENYLQYHKDKGKRAIAYALRHKGIESELLAEGLSGLDEDTQLEAAKALAEPYRRKYAALDKRQQKAKLSAMLARRGFTWDIISQVVGEEADD